ncbi:MAG: hypothetical protein WCL08_05100 [Verrucomicrobiota bacterium]
MTTALTVLPLAEIELLDSYESRIEKGLSSFIDVGEALTAIRDARLYRAEHGTFEDYCRVKWGMSDNYARRLIVSSEAVKTVPMGTVTTERQARELSRVEPEHRAAVVERAIQATGGKITAAAIREAAKPDESEELEVTIEAPLRHLSAAAMTEAHDLWLIAKGRLDNIRKNDPERVAILREVIAYAQQRINHNK